MSTTNWTWRARSVAVLAVVATIGALVVAAGASPSAAAVAVEPITWEPCDGGGECATYRVPLDHTDPEGPEISLALWRAPAVGDPGQRIGSLFVNPGGPGASGIDFAKSAVGLLSSEVRERFDVIGFDPRGVGSSAPAALCPSPAAVPVPDDDDWTAYFADYGETTGAAGAMCSITTGALRDHLGTRQVAADLDRLRAAVGDEKLTYWGGSYGTRLGYTYAALFPGRVRVLVLDGAVDPAATELSFLYERAGSYDDAYQFFRSSYPTVAARIDAILAEFDGGTERVHLDGNDIDITAASFLMTIHQSLSSEMAWPSIVEFVDDAYASIVAGTPTPIESPDDDLVPDLDGPGEPGPPPPPTASNLLTILRNVNCIDLPAADISQAPQLAAQMTTLGPVFGGAMAASLTMCQTFPVNRFPIPTAVPATVPPVLVIGSLHDPATPYVWAQRLAATLPGARLLTYGGAAHVAWNLTRSACVDELVDAYVVDLTAPTGPVTCEFASPIDD